MCKTVYLTSKRFDRRARLFKLELKKNLEQRGVEVVLGDSYDLLNSFRKHKTYGIALAFDFYVDGGEGRGLTLNKKCSNIGRDLAYTISNNLDSIIPSIPWKNFDFVKSYDKNWYKFFNKVSSETKAIFHLCTSNNENDVNIYNITFDKIVSTFSDEIVRCLRSDYNSENYKKRVKIANRRKKD